MAFASSTIRSKRSATGPPSEQLALLQGGGRGGVPDSGVRRSKRLLSCHDSDQLVGYSGGVSMALRACTLSNRVASGRPTLEPGLCFFILVIYLFICVLVCCSGLKLANFLGVHALPILVRWL